MGYHTDLLVCVAMSGIEKDFVYINTPGRFTGMLLGHYCDSVVLSINNISFCMYEVWWVIKICLIRRH